jgi:dTDP-4-dehydrorhamnose reductase
MTPRLFVTGGRGYLGRVVVERASAAGWDVTAPPSSELDIRDAGAVADAVTAAHPDAVVHTAYVRDGPSARGAIVDGTANVVRAVAGRRLVHLSTDVVFDGRLGRPYREADPVSPVTDYGRAKVAAEAAVAGADDGVAVRTSLIYGGPGRPPSPHELVAVDQDATFYDDELRCPIQVDDLAAAVVELLGVAVTGVLHVAGPAGLSRADFAALVAGRDVRRGPAPPGRPLDCRLDTSRAARLLTAPPRPPGDVFGTR